MRTTRRLTRPTTRDDPKRRRMHDSDASDDDVEPRHLLRTEDEWCSPRLYAEILEVLASLESVGAHSDSTPSSTPLEAVRQIRGAIRNLTEPLSIEVLALHTRSALDILWHQARQAVEHEMRAKLTFWKHKAQHLRKNLHAFVQANAATEKPAPPIVQEALDFVSTFYLLEMAPDQSRTEDPFREMAIASTNENVSRAVHRLQLQRTHAMPPEQPLADSLLLLSHHATHVPTERQPVISSSEWDNRQGTQDNRCRILLLDTNGLVL